MPAVTLGKRCRCARSLGMNSCAQGHFGTSSCECRLQSLIPRPVKLDFMDTLFDTTKAREAAGCALTQQRLATPAPPASTAAHVTPQRSLQRIPQHSSGLMTVLSRLCALSSEPPFFALSLDDIAEKQVVAPATSLPDLPAARHTAPPSLAPALPPHPPPIRSSHPHRTRAHASKHGPCGRP